MVRLGGVHAARHVDERAAAEAGAVAHRERVLPRDDPPEMGVDELRVLLGGDLERLHDHAVGQRGGVRLEADAVDLREAGARLHLAEEFGDALDGGLVATRRGAVVVEVEPREVGELPARRALELRKRWKLGERRGAHPMEPSICNSMRRFISTAYSIGSSLVIGSMKPFTMSFEASSSGIPRDWR